MSADTQARPTPEPESHRPDTSTPTDRLSRKDRARLWASLAVIVLMSELAPMELTLVYPSLRHMVPDFRTPHIAWVLTIVSLSAIVSIPLVGKLADRYGKKRAMLALGLAFAVGSLLCATAQSFGIMLTGRALQGTCGGITAVAYALIRDTFPRRIVPVALGAVSAGIGVSAFASPFIAGALIDNYGYRSVFWFMFVYVAVLIPLVAWVVPESPLRLKRALDIPGVLLLGSGVGLVLLAVSQGRAWGWWSAGTLAAEIGGVLLLTAFVVWELRVAEPAIDVRLIAGPAMRNTLAAALFVGFLIGAYGLLMPQMLQTPEMPGLGYGLGLTATGVAVWTFPQGLVTMAAGPAGGAVARTRGARVVLIGAACALVAALLAASTLPDQRGPILAVAALVGLGMGLYYAAGPNLVVDAVPPEQGGIGASMLPVANQLGTATAATVLGAVMAQNIAVTDPRTGQIVYADTAYQHAFLIAAAVGLVGVLIAVVMRHGRAPARGGAAAP